MRVCIGNGQQIKGSHPRRQQRLMGIAKRRVGDQQSLLLQDPLRKSGCAKFLQLVTGSLRRINTMRHTR